MDRKQTCYNIMISSHGFTRRNRFHKDTHEFLRMHRKWIRVKEASWYARGRTVLVGQQNILKFRKFHPKPIFLASPENSEESTNMEHSHSLMTVVSSRFKLDSFFISPQSPWFLILSFFFLILLKPIHLTLIWPYWPVGIQVSVSILRLPLTPNSFKTDPYFPGTELWGRKGTALIPPRLLHTGHRLFAQNTWGTQKASHFPESSCLENSPICPEMHSS